MDRTSTDHSDLGHITVCRATRTKFWFGDSVTVDRFFVTKEIAIFLSVRPNALIKTTLKVLNVIFRIEGKMPRT